MGCPWYAELPQEGNGVAARPFTAVSAMPMRSNYTGFVHMTASPSTRSLINDHKIGRPKVPGGSTG